MHAFAQNPSSTQKTKSSGSASSKHINATHKQESPSRIKYPNVLSSVPPSSIRLTKERSKLIEQRTICSEAVQLKTDATPPASILEEYAAQGEAPLEATGGEGSDSGQGVASIEAGSSPAIVEKEGEEPAAAPVQAKAAQVLPSSRPRVSTTKVVGRLGPARSLDTSLRANLESYYGQSFGDVSVHTGSGAAQVTRSFGAQALTVGPHVAFSPGTYSPSTTSGRNLIAHEIAHVVQQRKGLSGEILHRGLGQPGDKWEREADELAVGFSQGSKGSGAPNCSSIATRSPAVQLYSGSKAASYAQSWAKSTNPAYGRFSNDCTNFVSQAMLAGGWSKVVGSSYCDDRKKDSVWWHKRGGCRYDSCPWYWCPTLKSIDASYTWGGAHNFSKFIKSSGRGSHANHVMDLGVGDVLQADWDSDGNISHAMIVTKKTSDNLFLTYHTSDHLDEPFYKHGKNNGMYARHPDPPTSYYGWKL